MIIPAMKARVIEVNSASAPMLMVTARASDFRLCRPISIPTKTSSAPRTPTAMMERTWGEVMKRAGPVLRTFWFRSFYLSTTVG